MSISEPLDDPWADSGPSDRLPASRRTGDHGRGRDEQHDRGPDRGVWDGGGSAFERVPPQDLEAEQSVLGGMLLSKDAIADVVEILKGHDFYKPPTRRSTPPSSTSTPRVSRPTRSPSPRS